jgi:2-methylcitrate dehydratase PrpD
MSGSLLEFTSDGSWSKRLHLGWAAHGGILAARLAAAGFPGPASILEGRFGIYNAFLGEGVTQIEGATADLGDDWRSSNNELKFYPTAHVIQPFLEAALDLRQRENLDPRLIERVECRVAPWYAPIVCTPRPEKLFPRTDYHAQASLPYTLAAALVDGRVDLDTFTTGAIARREILDMASRITHVEDEQLSGFQGVLAICMRGGQQVFLPATQPQQDDGQRILAKFRSNARRQWPEERVTALEASLKSLDQRPLKELLDALIPCPRV